MEPSATGIPLTVSLGRTHSNGNKESIEVSRAIGIRRIKQDLSLSFRRTVRVADNKSVNDLPPDLGSLPLYEVKNYESKLPGPMAAKGGFFFPMHQREAMWINIESR